MAVPVFPCGLGEQDVTCKNKNFLSLTVGGDLPCIMFLHCKGLSSMFVCFAFS